MNEGKQAFCDLNKSVLQNSHACGIIRPSKYEWFYCPHCRGKLLKIYPTTKVKDLPALCRKCRNETVVNIP